MSVGVNDWPALVLNADFRPLSYFPLSLWSWHESVKAVVVLKPEQTATAQEIIDTAGEHLARYQKPKSVDFVESLPKAPTGKILKRELKEPYWQDQHRNV